MKALRIAGALVTFTVVALNLVNPTGARQPTPTAPAVTPTAVTPSTPPPTAPSEQSDKVSDVLPLQGTWNVKGDAQQRRVVLTQEGSTIKGRFELQGSACFTVEGTASRTGADLNVFYTRPTGPPCATSPLDQDVWDEVLKQKGDPAHPGAVKTEWHLKCGERDVELTGDLEYLFVPYDRDRATGKITLKDPKTGEVMEVRKAPLTLTGPLAIGRVLP